MTSSKKRILCVGIEAATDPEGMNEIAAMHPHWEVKFCSRSLDALRLLTQEPFDAVVAFGRLPDMQGLQLLNKVQKAYPDACRVIVSDLSQRSSVVRCAGVAHHWISNPIEPETLRQVLDRSFGLNIWLSNPTVRALVSRMTRIPSPPTLYIQVVRALQSPNVDIEEIAERITKDLAMTAKLLQLANSASLGLRVQVSNVPDALKFLGLETTRSLILLAHAFSWCEPKRLKLSIDNLWHHSLATGALARRIAREEGADPDMVDECFLAGLLHDIGKLLLAVNLGPEYDAVVSKAREKGLPLWQVEMEQFGATHAEIGAELLAIWNLPLPVIEALALHHYPSKLVSRTFGPLVAAHVANVFHHSICEEADPAGHSQIDQDYLLDLSLADRLPVWEAACREELAEPVLEKI